MRSDIFIVPIFFARTKCLGYSDTTFKHGGPMRKVLVSLLLTAMPLLANAGELDREPTNDRPQFSGTVVVRVDTRNSNIAILHSDKTIGTDSEARTLAAGKFTSVPQEKVKHELDRDAGTSSWYVYWAATPSYCYYGTYYAPYYYYSYGYYGYYYYGNPYARWWR